MRCTTLLLLLLADPAAAQWNPAQGKWGKSDPADLRIMTWNVRDAICSTNAKSEGLNNWHGVVRTVAALKPDVLVLQETGDNGGNGSGSGVDTRAVLRGTLDLLRYGGPDPYRAGNPQVTAFLQKYDPNFDMPFQFVSEDDDGFNRNVLLSRFAPADLNGDGVSRYSDIPLVLTGGYAPGGDGGIRGFMFAELDLPDATYAGDLVVGNAHLKSGSDASDRADRLLASQNVAYFIDHFYNGAGLNTPDPHGRIFDLPPATHLPGPATAVVIAGDWNEDESKNGRRGPAAWLTEAAQPDGAGGGDGTDRDRSDMRFDAAANVFTGSTSTQSSSKLDYVAWQDSVASVRRAFIFDTAGLTATQAPAEIADYAFYQLLTGVASDHKPVIVDLILPGAPAACPTDLNGNGSTDLDDLLLLLTAFGAGAAGDTDGDGDTDLEDLLRLLGAFGSCPQ